MATRNYIVDDLVSEIRYITDEQNVDAVTTDFDILPALNRAQEYAYAIYASKYPKPLLASSAVTLTAGTSSYDIPEDAFQDRLLGVEIASVVGASGNLHSPLQEIDHKEVHEWESTTTTPIPDRYYIAGRQYHLVPAPSGAYNARIWYIREPERLVLSQGRVTSYSSGSRTITVDSLGTTLEGTDLTTTSTSLGSYVNIINGRTGKIRGTCQLSALSSTTAGSESTLTFRSSPIRTSVMGRTVSGSIPSDIAVDDYVCIVTGTCVLPFRSPTSNFITQYAAAEIMASKTEGTDLNDQAILEKFERQLSRTWGGRPSTAKIRLTSRVWGK